MKVRNVLILLLVVLIIASCCFVVIHGIPLGGAYSFEPLSAVKMGLDLTGGLYIVYEAADPTIENIDAKIEGAMDIFRSRLDSKGYTEATITKQGAARIRVEVPINDTTGDIDAQEVIEYIGNPAKLEFLGPDGEVIVEGKELVSAQASVIDTGAYVVSFKMTAEGGKKFAAATQEFLGQDISITLDDYIISTATVNSVIPNGEGYIEGGFTVEEAQDLAMQIESGALPLELNVLEHSNISATLGDEALNNSILAGIIGLAVLMVFMIVMYRLPGLVADIALCAYVAIVLFALGLFEIQLTLPGIAGIVLGVGMAVDANVVIFSRFKEEYYTGKSIRASLKGGFNKAARAITDSNVTTLIAAVVLAIFGTGAIKGFAYTLAISIVVSLITALLITQALLKLVIGIAPNAEKLYFPAKKGGAEK